MVLWIIVLGLFMCWGLLTFLFWMESVPNLNALSIAALWLACGAGIQSSLAMRKADSNDKF